MIQKIVGISFNPTKAPGLEVGKDVKVTHDADNQYSSRAIAVKRGDLLLGHIGEKNNPKHEEIFEALPITAKVCTLSRLQPGEEFAKFKEGEITHLEIEFDMASDEQEGMKSFNEDITLKFDPVAHRYVHEGKELVSASTYIKRWIKPFDKEMISGVCAGKYGCSQQEVLDLWDGSGDVAATFGTSVHEALEHYEKFQKIGKIIQDQKDLPFNKALPTHPVLRDIVLAFYDQDLEDGIVNTEVLLTNVELGLCGQADRLLVTGDKTCRVQDYKINIDADVENKRNKYLGQMAPLPCNKLSKYQMQLSFYARLLELSGWKVEGLTVFVYDVEWKQYDLPVLKLDF